MEKTVLRWIPVPSPKYHSQEGEVPANTALCRLACLVTNGKYEYTIAGAILTIDL